MHDFTEVKMRVENGDSVFVTRRENEKIDISSLKHKTKKEDAIISPHIWTQTNVDNLKFGSQREV